MHKPAEGVAPVTGARLALLNKLREPYLVGLVSRILGQVISFVTVVVGSRYLDLDAYGNFALAWAAAVIGNTFVFTGLYQALLRAPDEAHHRDTLFWLNLALGAAFMLVILGFGFASGGLATPRGFALITLAPIPLLIVPQAWWEAQLVRARRVRSASLYVLIAEASALAVAIVLLTRGWTLGALIASRYVAVIVGLVLTGGLVRRLPRLSIRRDASAAGVQTAVPLWATTAVNLFSNYGTDLVLGAFAPAAVIGAYRGGARIAITASDLVLQPLGLLTWSRFTRIEKENAGLGALREAWSANMSLAAAILWPLSVTVAMLAPVLVATVLDEAWLPAAQVVTILTVSRAIMFFGALLEPTLMTTGYGRRQFTIRLWGAGSLLAMLVLFARYGAEAAAWAHLASSVLVAVLALGGMMRAMEMGARELVASFIPAGIMSALTALAILITNVPRAGMAQLPGLLLALGAVSVVWIGLMALFLRRRLLRLPTP